MRFAPSGAGNIAGLRRFRHYEPRRVADVPAALRTVGGRGAVDDLDGFQVRSVREGSWGCLAPVGERDIATIPVLEREFHVVHRDEAIERIVVDLRGVTFIDASGSHLLERMATLGERDRSVLVITGFRAVDLVIGLTDTRDRLPVLFQRDYPRTLRSTTSRARDRLRCAPRDDSDNSHREAVSKPNARAESQDGPSRRFDPAIVLVSATHANHELSAR